MGITLINLFAQSFQGLTLTRFMEALGTELSTNYVYELYKLWNCTIEAFTKLR